MTKYEAFEAIAAVSDDVSWIEYRDRILAIIDQIDQPPAEFSVSELCELIDATYENHPHLSVELFGNQVWLCGTFNGQGIETLRDKLVELAKPEDPEVMVPMKLSLVKLCAEFRDGEFAKACKTALKKAGVKL